MLSWLVVIIAELRHVSIFLERLTVSQELDASGHELMDVAEIEDILREISVFVKLEEYAKVAIANPLWQGMKE